MLPLNPSRSRLSLVCLVLILAAAPGRAADVKTDVHGDPLPDGAVARAGTIRWRTGAPIVLSAFLAEGKSVLTVSQDQVAQVWDATTGQELRRFDVSGGKTENTPSPINVLTAARLATIARGAAVSGDGKTLATTGSDGIVRLWDVATGKERARLARSEAGGPGGDMLALSRDGKRLARISFNQNTIYDATTGKELKQFGEAAPGPGVAGGLMRTLPYRIEFGPDAKTLLLVTVERDAAAQTTKAVLVIWDIENGKQLKRLDSWPEAAAPLRGGAPGGGFARGRGFGLTTAVNMVVSPDHKLAALPLDVKTIVLMDLSTGKEAKRIERSAGNWIGVGTLAFTADGKSLLVIGGVGGRVVVCDVSTGKFTEGKDTEGAKSWGTVSARAGVRQSFALSEDGKAFTWPEGSTLHVVEVATGKDRNTTTGHANPVQGVFFSADGKTLTTVSSDRAGRGFGAIGATSDAAVRRWDAATGKEEAAVASAALPRAGLATVSPDGKVFAITSLARGVLLVDVSTGKTLQTLKTDEPRLGAQIAVFSPDSRTVAITTPEETKVRLFDVASGLSKRELLLPNRTEETPFYPERRMVFSPDGRFIAVSDLKLHVFDAASGKESRALPIPEGATFRYAAFSPDGRNLAMELSDGEIQLFELASGKTRLVINAKTRAQPDPDLPPAIAFRASRLLGTAEPISLAIAPDGRLLAQTGEDGKVHLWDLRSGKEAAALAGHRGQVTTVAFSGDGKRLASGGSDTTALIWDAEALRKKLPRPVASLTRDKVESLWGGLSNSDAGRAYEAVCALAGDPTKAVPLLRERLKPAAAADDKLVTRLVADLDADEFDTRENAKKQLARLGESAAGALRKALENKPSAEMKRNIDELLAGLNGATPSDDRVLLTRALETLEMIGTPEAVAVLKSLAGGAPDTFLTNQAKAALERLRK
jgi:WD40 repeat protein